MWRCGSALARVRRRDRLLRALHPRPDRDPERLRLGRGAPGLEPGGGPAAGGGRPGGERGRRLQGDPLRQGERPQGGGAGDRPRGGGARAARRRDPDQDRAHARRRDRGREGARRGRRAGRGRRRGRERSGDVLDAGDLAQRRGHRLHARRRAELVRPQVRLGLQPGERHRAGDRRRRAPHGGRGERPRPLLGTARRRRRIRDRHRAARRAPADRRGLRRRPALPGRADARRPRRLPRVGRARSGGGRRAWCG